MITLVQSVLCGSNTVTNTGGNVSCTGNFPVATTAGNLLVLVAFFEATGGTPNATMTPVTAGITWDVRGGWSQVQTTPSVWKGSGVFAFAGNAPSVSSSTTVTVTYNFGITTSITKSIQFCLFEFSGVKQISGSGAVDNAATLNGTASTPNVGNLSTTDKDLLISAFVGVTGNLSAGPGYTLAQTLSAVQFGQIQYQLNVPAGSIPTAWTGTENKWASATYALLPGIPSQPTYTFVFQDPSGAPLANGKASFRLIQDGILTTFAASQGQVAAGVTVTLPLDVNGSVSLNLAPSDQLSPAGIYVIKAYNSQGLECFSEQATLTSAGAVVYKF